MIAKDVCLKGFAACKDEMSTVVFYGVTNQVSCTVGKRKAPWQLSHGALFLERDTRFELATSTLARSHSTTELVPQISVRQ